MQKNSNTEIGSGYCYNTQSESAIEIDAKIRFRHTWTFGTTGVGKTRLLEYMAIQDIKRGCNVIILDPKNDGEIFSKVIQAAIECRRLGDVRLLTPIFPGRSCKLNPLEYYRMDEEIVSIILAGVEMGKEPFYYNVANESTTAIVQSLNYIRRREGIMEKLNFNDIKDRVSAKELEEIYNILKIYKNDRTATHMAKDLKKIIESGADYYSRIIASLRVAMMELTTGNTGRIIGNIRGNDIVKRIEENKGMIFLAQLGSLLTSKTAATISRVLLSMIKTLAGRTFAEGKALSPPLSIYLDEAQNVIFQGFEDLLSKSGSGNIMVNCFSQSVNQIYAAIGDERKGNSILDNINTKIFMRAPDEKTAQYATEHFGRVRKLSGIYSVGGTPNYREMEEELIPKEAIMSLAPQEFIMRSAELKYIGKVTTTEPAFLNIKYPSIASP
jgi:type IV secretory pathway TraG/TraD family ATPase VirD4